MVGNSVEREAPRTVSEVLRRVDEAWLRFNDAAEAFPSERMDDHLEGGWTRKQMLAHVGAWHDLTTDRLTKLATSGETVELTEDEDAINARVARQAVGRTAGEVLKDMELSFNRLRRQIARMTDDQLMTDEGWATRIIAGNTYEHYDEHWPDVYQPPPPDARGGRR